MANKTCTVLVEITNACNLSCKVCYSDARGDRVMPAELFEQYIQRLVAEKGTLDSVQLTGWGERRCCIRGSWEIAAFLHRQEGGPEDLSSHERAPVRTPRNRRKARPLSRQAHGAPAIRRPLGRGQSGVSASAKLRLISGSG